MANRKLAAPQAQVDSLDHMSPDARTELATQMQQVAVVDERADTMFGDGREYSLDRVIEHIDIHGAILEDATLQLGRYFCWMKEREGHGNFEVAIETRTRFSVRSAQVFMGLARELLDEKGNPIPLLEYVKRRGGNLSKSKMIELAHMQPEALAKLGAGEEVAGLTRDDVATMSVSALRAAIRAGREEKTADQTLIDQKDEKINKLQRALTKAQRGGVEFEEHAYAELLQDITTDANVGFASVVAGLARLKDCGEKLAQASVPAHLEDIAKRAHVMTLNTATLQLAESVARVIWEQEALFGKFLNDAPHRLSTLEGHGDQG